MARYVYSDGRLVDKDTGVPMPHGKWNSVQAPQVMRDIKPYRSPIDGRWIDGKRERREDLKRNGCREVDPGEWSGEYRKDKYRENDWKAAKART